MLVFNYIRDIIDTFIAYFQEIKIDDPQNHIIILTRNNSKELGGIIARRLLEKGYFLVELVMSISSSDSFTFAKTQGFQNHYLKIICDARKEEDVRKAYDRVEVLLQSNKLLKLWALINHTGVRMEGCADWLSIEAYHKTFDMNFFAIVNLTKVFLQQLKRCKNSRIINICSMAGIYGSANLNAYSASKHALEGFAKCLRLELMPWNVHVTNINPGFLISPIVEKYVKPIFENNIELIKDQYTSHDIFLDQGLEESNYDFADCVLENITRASPTFNNYPGFYALPAVLFGWLIPSVVIQIFRDVSMKYSRHRPTPEALQN